MRRTLLLAGILLAGSSPCLAGDTPQSTQNESLTDGSLEGGWVVSVPTGSSDYFNNRFDGLAGRPVRGVSIGAADFGTSADYPMAGLFDANLSLDPSGNTPDLTSGWSVSSIPPGGSAYDYRYVSLGGIVYPASEPQHVVVQLPPGDSGLLGVGGDADGYAPGNSAWSGDGYANPAIDAPVIWGLNVNIDATTELNGSGHDGRLRCFHELGDQTGDLSSIVVHAGDSFGLVFFAPFTGSRWLIFSSLDDGPLLRTSGVLTTTDDPPGSYFRDGTTWPFGLGSLRIGMVAVSGVPGVLGTVGTSDRIELVAPGDDGCPWGIRDDGTYEYGYVVQIPSGSSDFFNVNFNCGAPPPITEITGIDLAAIDFGSAATQFPLSGLYPSNYAIDPGGTTPDLSAPYESAPMTFPPGVQATTSAAMIRRVFASPIPYDTLVDDNLHGVIQLPPGDSGLLAVGADTDSTLASTSAWTIDAYTTTAYPFVYKVGLRLEAR